MEVKRSNDTYVHYLTRVNVRIDFSIVYSMNRGLEIKLILALNSHMNKIHMYRVTWSRRLQVMPPARLR